MIRFKGGHSLFKESELVAVDAAGADADAAAAAAHLVKAYRADSVGKEFVHKGGAAEAGVADGEEETVADGAGGIFLIADGEPVTEEYFLHPGGAGAVFANIFKEAQRAVATAVHHLGKAPLGAGGASGRNHVQYASCDGEAEDTGASVTGGKCRELLLIEVRSHA